jgi:glycosyltransferase involved in cell wall biosynthesis
MRDRDVKFVFNTMVKNESHCVGRMLESVWRYVDYWVIQDNGSTDGTQDIIRDFFSSKGIPGFLYETPWTGCMGSNRDHTVQTCLKADHGCDFILRVDADEILEVDDDFDWSLFDKEAQAFNVAAFQGGVKYHRTWIWNARLPWKFKQDKRHECVYLEGTGENFQRVQLPESFRHRVMGDGKTWQNPYKYYMDALELEKDLLAKNEMLSDEYHLYYIGKSYHDNVPSTSLPFGNDHVMEICRRSLFFFRKFLEVRHDFWRTGKPKRMDEMAYVTMVWMSNLHGIMGDVEGQIGFLRDAEAFCPARNEHLKRLALIFRRTRRFREMHEATSRMVAQERKNPFPGLSVLVEQDAYHDTGSLARELHEAAERGIGGLL